MRKNRDMLDYFTFFMISIIFDKLVLDKSKVLVGGVLISVLLVGIDKFLNSMIEVEE